MYWQLKGSVVRSPIINYYVMGTQMDNMFLLFTATEEILNNAYLCTTVPEYDGYISARRGDSVVFELNPGPYTIAGDFLPIGVVGDLTCWLGDIPAGTITPVEIRINFPDDANEGEHIVPIFLAFDDGSTQPNNLFYREWTEIWETEWPEIWQTSWDE